MTRKILFSLPYLAIVSWLSSSANANKVFENNAFNSSSSSYLGVSSGFATGGLAVSSSGEILSHNAPLQGNELDGGTVVSPFFANGLGLELSKTVRSDFTSEIDAPLPESYADLHSQVRLDLNGAPESASEVRLMHSSLGHVNNQTARSENGFALMKSNVPFNINAVGKKIPLELTIDLDANGFVEEGGLLGHGFTIEIMNVTDPENVEVVDSLDGLLTEDTDGILGEFMVDEDNVSDGFLGVPGSNFDDPSSYDFFYRHHFEGDASLTYALLVNSDLEVDSLGLGVAYLDSSSSLKVTLSSSDPTVSFNLEPSVVPEPNANCLSLVFIAIIWRLRSQSSIWNQPTC